MLHSHLTCKNVHNSKLNRNDIRMIFFCKAFVVKDSKFQKSDTTRGATTQLAHSLIRILVFGSQFWFGTLFLCEAQKKAIILLSKILFILLISNNTEHFTFLPYSIM